MEKAGPRAPSAGRQDQKEMSFLDHLEELRWTLVRSAVVVVSCMVVAFIFKSFIFDTVILAPKDPHFITYRFFCWLGKVTRVDELCITDLDFDLQNIQMSGQFMTHLMVSFIAGLIVAFPYVLWEVWRFIGPGLHHGERRAVRGFVGSASLLFLIGVAFGYYVLAPLSVQFFGTYTVSAAVRNTISLESYIGIVTSVTLWTGVVFELPLVVVILSRIGLIGPSFLRTYRKHALVVILIIAAILTPPDVISQLVVSAPLMLLYEFSILLSARIERRRLAQARSAMSPAIVQQA
jgi:sec-independent protein translocase protein TatC